VKIFLVLRYSDDEKLTDGEDREEQVDCVTLARCLGFQAFGKASRFAIRYNF